MQGEYEVRWFRDGDLPYFLRGLNEDLWDEYTEEVFKWKFRRAPINLGFTPIAVVEHTPTNRPAAFNSFLPIQVRHDDTVFMAVQGCDGFVFREHRHKGLFQMTLRFLSEEMKGKEPELLLGFNLVEAAGAAHKAGSEYTYDLSKGVIEGDALKDMTKVDGVDLEPINVRKYHELYEEWASGSQMLHIFRSIPYLRWRIYENPVRDYTVYRVGSRGRDIGYIAVDVIEEEGGTTMTLADYNPGLLEEALPNVVSGLKQNHPKVTRVELNAKTGSKLCTKAAECLFGLAPMHKVIMMALNNTCQKEGVVYREGVKVSEVTRWHVTNVDIF